MPKFKGDSIMGLEIVAVYDNGVLKLERELPLENGQKVLLTIHPPGGRAKKSYGLMGWTGSSEDLEKLLGPENLPWVPENDLH
jgi:predicted DNA-binding antitoxin AbrB/MazE fold protein